MHMVTQWLGGYGVSLQPKVSQRFAFDPVRPQEQELGLKENCLATNL